MPAAGVVGVMMARAAVQQGMYCQVQMLAVPLHAWVTLTGLAAARQLLSDAAPQ
jgi:hypothetical protein